MHISPDEIEKHITEDDPKPLISSTKAAERFDITNDYVTLLCRQKKVSGSLIGRMWYVEPESLQKFLKEVRAKKSEQNAALAAKFKEARKKTVPRSSVQVIPVLDETPKKSLVISPAAQVSPRKKLGEKIASALSRVPVPSAQFAGRTMALASLYIVAATSTYALQVKVPEPVMHGYLSFLDGVGEIQADAYRDLGKGIALALDTSTKAIGVDDNVAAVVSSGEKLESPFFGFSLADTWHRFLALFERSDTHYAVQTTHETNDENLTRDTSSTNGSIYGSTPVPPFPSSPPASSAVPSTPSIATRPASSAATSIVNNYNTYPVVERVVTTSGSTLPAETYIAILSEFSRTLRSEMSRSIGESIANSRRGSGQLSLSVSDVPDLSGSYLSLAGGNVTGDVSVSGSLGIGTTSPSDTLALQGALYLAQISAPSNTVDRLYNDGGDLYFAGNLIGGGSTGTWDSDGTNVWRAGGNVGIGTSSPLGDIHVHSGLPDVAGTIYLSNSLTGARDQIGTYSPLGEIWFGSTEAVSYQAAGIRAVGGWGVNQDFNTNDTPAHLIFLTTPNNSSVAQERLMITSGGMVLIGYGDNPQIEGTGGINESPGSLIVNRNIGVGTTSPYARLSVVGQVAAEYYVATSTTATSTFAGGFSVGTSNFNVLQNGNVGIGTASPSSKLQLRTTANEAQTFTLSGDYYNSGVTTNTNVILSQFQRGNTGILQDSGKIIFGKESIWNTLNDIDGYIAFQTTQNQSLTERLRITSAGNVGIGTSSPYAKLSVAGQGVFDSIWATSTSATNYFAGNVGIGTASPNATLTIGGVVNGGSPSTAAGDYQLALTAGGVDGALGHSIAFNSGNVVRAAISSADEGSNGSTGLAFITGNNSGITERLRITTAGNVGIGTTSPYAKLSVNGDTVITGNLTVAGFTATSFITAPYFVATDAAATSTFAGGFSVGSTNFNVLQNGNVGIGTASPAAKLEVNGNILGNSYFVTPSIIGSVQAGFIADGDNRTTVNMGINKAQFGGRDTSLAGSIMRFDVRTGYPLFSVIYDAPGATGGGGDEYFPFQITSYGQVLVGNGWGGDNNAGTNEGQDLQVHGAAYFGGNIGIGTTSPYAKLSVAGQGVFDSIWATSTAPNYFAGNVGIGTMSPEALLHVEGSTTAPNDLLRIINNNSGTDLAVTSFLAPNMGAGDNTGFHFGKEASNNNRGTLRYTHVNDGSSSNRVSIDFYGSNDLLNVLASGNVGIGTTSPYSKLTVWGANTLAGSKAFEVVNSASSTALSIDNAGFISAGYNNSNFFTIDAASGTTTIANLSIGNLNFETNAGIVALSNIPVDSSAAQGVIQSQSINIGDTPVATFYGESDGAGGVQNLRMGVGTTTPWGKFSIHSTAGTPQFVIGSSTTQFIVGQSGNVGIGTTSPYAKLSVEATTGDNSFAIGSSTSSHFVVNSSGNVGVGTAEPISQLHITTNGTAATRGITLDQHSDGVQAPLFNFRKSRGTLVSPSNVASGDYTGMFFFQNYEGNAYRNNAGFGARVNGTVASNSVPTDLFFYTSAVSDMDPFTNGTVRMLIDSLGNVGIGTTSPYAKLSVVGEIAARNFTATSTSATTTIAGGLNVGSGAINYDFSTGVTAINNLAVGSWNFDTDAGIVTWVDLPISSAATAGTVESYTAQIGGSNVLTVYGEANGSGAAENLRVGIGTSTPWHTLSVSGTVGFDGLTGATGAGSLCLDSNKQVVYNSTSNDCLESIGASKHDIKTLGLDGIATLKEINPVSFIYNWDTSSTTRFGFIADDVARIDPHLVTYNAEGKISGLDNYSLIAVIVKAFKELVAKVDSFAQRFTTEELCVGSVCVTEEEFLAIVNAANIEPASGEPVEEEPIVEEPTEEEPAEEVPIEEEPAPEEPIEETPTDEEEVETETEVGTEEESEEESQDEAPAEDVLE